MSDSSKTQIGSWQRSEFFEKLWPKDRLLLWQLDPKDEISKIVWSGQRDVDFRNMADLYYDAGYKIADEIIQSGYDNLKTDTWLLAGFFMFRQAIELILKSKIYSTVSNFNKVQAIFTSQQHDINRLLKTVIDLGGIQLDDEKVNWLTKYISDVELWDAQSTLFRYPFKARFFKQNPPRSVDVYWTAEKLSIAYALLRGTCPEAEQYLKELPDKFPNPVFFSDTRPDYPVCYLRTDTFRDSYFSVIEAYVSISEFLLTDGVSRPGFKTKLGFNFPAAFSMRHVLELSLKQLAVSQFSEIQALNIKRRINTHRIYSDLWKKLAPVITKTAGSESDTIGINVSQFIEDFQEIDCKGDFFRYPTEYNQEYHRLKHGIDLMNILKCVRAATNLLDGCDGLFDDYARYEAEACR